MSVPYGSGLHIYRHDGSGEHGALPADPYGGPGDVTDADDDELRTGSGARCGRSGTAC